MRFAEMPYAVSMAGRQPDRLALAIARGIEVMAGRRRLLMKPRRAGDR